MHQARLALRGIMSVGSIVYSFARSSVTKVVNIIF